MPAHSAEGDRNPEHRRRSQLPGGLVPYPPSCCEAMLIVTEPPPSEARSHDGSAAEHRLCLRFVGLRRSKDVHAATHAVQEASAVVVERLIIERGAVAPRPFPPECRATSSRSSAGALSQETVRLQPEAPPRWR